MTKAQQAEQAEAIVKLREWLTPGDTVHTVVQSVSKSGMSREIRVLLLKCDGDRVVTLHPNHAIGQALGLRQGKRDGLVVSGCGMDMGFHLVYELSSVLWPKGYGCAGEKCRSNDHSNGDRSYAPHSDAAPHWHNDGGYALRHEWL